jgi:hypothetical protein
LSSIRGKVAHQPRIGIDAIGKPITRGSIASDRMDVTVAQWLDVDGIKDRLESQVEESEALIDSLQDQVSKGRSWPEA